VDRLSLDRVTVHFLFAPRIAGGSGRRDIINRPVRCRFIWCQPLEATRAHGRSLTNEEDSMKTPLRTISRQHASAASWSSAA